jgi:uncharacterized protein YbaA (DUF1428 family)
MAYVDGFVLPIAKKNLKQYKKIASGAGKIWKEHGALEYKECAAEDLRAPGMNPFNKAYKTKSNETIILAYIVYKSRKHRDAVNKKVMMDPRMSKLCSPNNVPFDVKRMSYGGFEIIVNAK